MLTTCIYICMYTTILTDQASALRASNSIAVVFHDYFCVSTCSTPNTTANQTITTTDTITTRRHGHGRQAALHRGGGEEIVRARHRAEARLALGPAESAVGIAISVSEGIVRGKSESESRFR